MSGASDGRARLAIDGIAVEVAHETDLYAAGDAWVLLDVWFPGELIDPELGKEMVSGVLSTQEADGPAGQTGLASLQLTRDQARTLIRMLQDAVDAAH